MFCSICGEKLVLKQVRICRTCGILFCPYCCNSNHGRISKEGKSEPTIQCMCGSKEILPLEDLRLRLARDFLNLKRSISLIANYPVKFFQELMDFHESLIKEGDNFVFFPEDFTFSGEVTAALATAEQFSLGYLQDLSINLKSLYDQLILKQESLEDPERLQSIQIQLKMLDDKLKSFELGIKTYFKSFESEYQVQRSIFNRYLGFRAEITNNLGALHDFFSPTNRVLYITSNMSSNLTGVVGGQVRILLTNQELIVFKTIRLTLKSRVKTLLTANTSALKDAKIQYRRFRDPKLIIYLTNGFIEFSGSKNMLQTLKSFIERFKTRTLPKPPRHWKNWKIIWSAEGYTSLIDAFLHSDQSISSTNFEHGFFPRTEGSSSLFNLGSKKSDQQIMLIEHFEGQLEKNSQRIKICSYIINDLKSRKNQMSINEYYSLYENFSMKLKELETDRNNLLVQYQQVIT